MTINIFFGYKFNQLQTFNDKGKRLVVTLIKALPLTVARVKTIDKDNYPAYQVEIKGFGKKRPKKFLREIRLEDQPEMKMGEKIEAKRVFKVGDTVQVLGTTKGRGFAGVVKRWGFAGGPKTHGQSDRERAPGSIGQRTTPGRVWKGKKMPGHMGNKLKTVKGLKVFKIDEEKNELWLTGLVPGAKGGLVKISKTKNQKPKTQT